MKTISLKKLLIILLASITTTITFAQDTTGQTTQTPVTDPDTTVDQSRSQEVKNKYYNSAGLFLEPFLTYEQSDVDIDYPAPFSSSTESVDGFGIGARLGFHFAGIVFIAADARYSHPQYDSSALSGKADAKSYNLGGTVGVQTPFAGLRIWGTYIFDGVLDPETINSVDLKFKELEGYRVGVGLYVAVVSINLEYQDATYDNTTLEQFGAFNANAESSIEAQGKSYILSVSFPISI